MVVFIVIEPKALPVSLTSFDRLFIIERKAVPACDDLIPALPIRPIASAVSSAENPNAPAIGAQYLNVSPIMETLVFALELAAARISAKCPESSADNPKAVSASVTMSDVVAKSSPDAAARFMIPSMPLSISLVFQPAMPIYVIACAASVAENFVLLPISRALARRSSKSFPVAPDIAATSLIDESKSAAVLTATVPSPVIATVAGKNFCPTLEILSPTVLSFSPLAAIFCTAVADWFAAVSSFFRSCSVSMISRCNASYCSLEISPAARALSACSAAVFSVSSLCLV